MNILLHTLNRSRSLRNVSQQLDLLILLVRNNYTSRCKKDTNIEKEKRNVGFAHRLYVVGLVLQAVTIILRILILIQTMVGTA